MKTFFFFFFESTCALCPWSLALASSIPVLGLESVCPRKGCPWPWPWPRIFFVSLALALASSLVSSTPPLTITPNFNTLKSRIELKNDYIVDFRIPNSIGDVLGFGSAFLGVNGIHNSQNPVNITNINSLQIHCSLIDGSYINGASSDLLYTLSPNVPPGYLIQVEPKQNIYVPIKNLSQIDSIRFSIKDQDNNFVNMNNERVTYYVHLREIM